jgi:hypothetical protein
MNTAGAGKIVRVTAAAVAGAIAFQLALRDTHRLERAFENKRQK